MLPKALNHMAVPGLRYDGMLTLAASLGCVGVEFRNDLPGALFDGDSPETVAAAARAAGLRILALAEVKSFNDFSEAKLTEARALCEVARACGAEAISLIPRNDNLGTGNGERQANLRLALRELAPLLQEFGLIGLIEPLGFEICALRSKAEAVDAIEALGGTSTFKLVHDTFHHHLAGEAEIFAAHTGIVHISGVTAADVGVADMQDAHRVLVDQNDRLGNIAQLEQLIDAGYDGPMSFEPFAPEIHALGAPAAALAESFKFITDRLTETATPADDINAPRGFRQIGKGAPDTHMGGKL